ncbi:hypothetical protein CANCADRAFT_101514 [Tortispora caseinolytica NRRL Y-17796]|uniref:Phosphotransferase n=1 Tax=Tortispora caseinolytica NRRL Y-17796 TaxID=767744 RepID=A0A1E4TED7_9ASCO|nr:hypothetical protein CANCADRAFT_101514 [Tortispora caseinolytica NRRL Y-17796]
MSSCVIDTKEILSIFDNDPESLLLTESNKKVVDMLSLFDSMFTRDSLIGLTSHFEHTFKSAIKTSPHTMIPTAPLTKNIYNKDAIVRGLYLAIDIGGSNARYALVSVDNNASDLTKILFRKSYAIPEAVKLSNGSEFFDWIAVKALPAIDYARSLTGLVFPLRAGITWSFPFDMNGNSLKMAKGFRVSESIRGWNIKDSLNRSFQLIGVPAIVCNVCHDASAVYLYGISLDPPAMCGLVLGTGLNVAFSLPTHCLLHKVPKDSSNLQEEFCIVNTEVGMFGTPKKFSSPWDPEFETESEPVSECDEMSDTGYSSKRRTFSHDNLCTDSDFDPYLPSNIPMEVIVSGRGLGSVFQNIVIELHDRSLIFSDGLPFLFSQPNAVHTENLSLLMEQPTFELIKSTFSDMFHSEASDCDIRIVIYVIKLIVSRSAAVLACALRALSLIESQLNDVYLQSIHCSAACCGSVMEKFPRYQDLCLYFLDKLSDQPWTLHSYAEATLVGPAISTSKNIP